MKKKLFWTNSSMDDLQLIYEYISNDAETYAPVFISELMEKVENIADFPKMGREVREMEDESVREIIFNSYRIIYKVSKDRIEITSVVHQRMKL